MRCIIIEDQPPAQRILKRYIHEYGSIELVETFEDALSARSILENGNIDLIFLDIHLPKLSGIDFLKTFKNPPLVILTTAFSDFAVESYALNVVDYLLKPFSFPRFIQAVDKAFQYANKNISDNQNEKHFFIKSGYEYRKVIQSEILFIKADGDYSEVHFHNKKLLSTDTLKEWIEKLDVGFIRVHRSFIINKQHILKLNSSAVILVGEVTIPIGRAYKNTIRDIL
ncbi:MAG: response regulator transcription factor [Saprospiraceae bacterium]|nr:response regulator transcription factor [Saprospiraceae bacterium]